MSTLFKIFGWILIALSSILALVMMSMNVIIFCIPGIIFGVALISHGDLMDRVDFLQEKLNLYAEKQTDDNLPQKTCSQCELQYDFDYPKCPHCGNETDNSKLE